MHNTHTYLFGLNVRVVSAANRHLNVVKRGFRETVNSVAVVGRLNVLVPRRIPLLAVGTQRVRRDSCGGVALFLHATKKKRHRVNYSNQNTLTIINLGLG